MDVMNNNQRSCFVFNIDSGVGLKSPLPLEAINIHCFGSKDFSLTQITDPSLLHLNGRGRENV